MKEYRVGDIAYLIESRRYIREGKIIRFCDGLYLFRFIEGGGTQISGSRLFPTEEAAQAELDRHRKRDPRQHLAFYL